MEKLINRLKEKGFDNEKFEAYVKNPNVKKIYNSDQLFKLKTLWYAEEAVEQEEEALEEPEEIKTHTFTGYEA